MNNEKMKSSTQLKPLIRDRFNHHKFDGQKFSKTVDIHGYYFDELQRKRVFGITGKINVYEDIQSHVCETDMNYIKEHLLESGSDIIDESLFADVSAVAPDLLENLSRSSTANDLFKSLPLAVREKYGNDIYRFANEFKKEDFIKKQENNGESQGVESNENKE